MELEFRNGIDNDKEWIFSLYVSTMKVYVERTWGWSDEFQKNIFNSKLHPTKFKIVSIKNENVGVFMAVEEIDHLWLEMLLIFPDWQDRGIGEFIVDKMKRKSTSLKLPLRLSVIRVNPAFHFIKSWAYQFTMKILSFANWSLNMTYNISN